MSTLKGLKIQQEMERKLRFLETEIKKDDIPMLDTGGSPEAPQPREMIDLEATFEKLEHELQEVNQNAEALKRNFLELTELKHILRRTQQFFDEVSLATPGQINNLSSLVLVKLTIYVFFTSTPNFTKNSRSISSQSQHAATCCKLFFN